MSAKKTHLYHISTATLLYPTYRAALDETNALKIHLDRKCKKHNLACLAYMGVSQRNPHAGYFRTNKFGAKEFVYVNPDKSDLVPAHLHIILFANPGRTVANIVTDYIKASHPDYYESTSKSPVNRVERSNRYINAINYVMNQCEKYRTVQHNVSALDSDFLYAILNQFEFCHQSSGGLFPIFQKTYEELAEHRETPQENN